MKLLNDLRRRACCLIARLEINLRSSACRALILGIISATPLMNLQVQAQPAVSTTPAIPDSAFDAARSVLGAQDATLLPSEITKNLRPKTVVFISTSIPVKTLEMLFRSVAPRTDVIFYLRGWTPPDIQPTLAYVGEALQATARAENGWVPTVGVDPTVFRAYNVTSVPTVLTLCQDSIWRRSVGELSIPGSEQEACQSPGAVVGNTYRVAEPDILDVIEQRATSMDWDGIAERAEQRADAGEFVTAVALPPTSEPSRRKFDPSIALTSDVRLPSTGQLLARKGDRINPLALAKPPTIIVWNPSQARERPIVERWLKTDVNAFVMLTNVMLPDGKPAAQVMQRAMYPLSAQIVERTGVTHTPSIIRADDRLLTVQTE